MTTMLQKISFHHSLNRKVLIIDFKPVLRNRKFIAIKYLTIFPPETYQPCPSCERIQIVPQKKCYHIHLSKSLPQLNLSLSIVSAFHHVLCPKLMLSNWMGNHDSCYLSLNVILWFFTCGWKQQVVERRG